MHAARGVCAAPAVLAALCLSAHVEAQPAPAAGHGGAYLDPQARRLVQGARGARDSASLALESYAVRARERHLWQFDAPRSSYVIQDYQQEYRFRWARNDAAVMRMDAYWILHSSLAGDPPYGAGMQAAVKRGLDPYRSPFRFALAMLPETVGAAPETGKPEFVSPLDSGAEQFYRYRSGDTVTVSTPGGQTVRAVAVNAVPRRRAVRFVSAVLWIEAESFGLVRLAFRPAKPIDSELVWCVVCEGGGGPRVLVDLAGGAEGAPGDASQAPGGGGKSAPGVLGRLANAALRSAMPRMELGVAAVVADYALWDSRHWLPRSMTLEASMAPVDEFVANDELRETSGGVSSQVVFDVEEIRERGADPETALEVARRWQEPEDHVDEAGRPDPAATWTLRPPDSLARLRNRFAGALWDEESLHGDGATERMASELAAIEGEAGEDAVFETSPWSFEPPLLTLRLLGYSRDEGFSAGTRIWRRFPWGRAVVSARIGTKLTEPRATFAVEREFPDWRVRVSAYHDLRPAAMALDFGAVEGRAARWYAADGIALRAAPARRNRAFLSLRVFAERHDESGPGAHATRAGAAGAWTPWWGGRAGRLLQGGGELSVEGAVGRGRLLRIAATAAVVVGRDRPWSFAAEGGGARTWSRSRRADPWLLDGSGDWLRGHPPLLLPGAVVWRGRADAQRRLWFVRLSAFADWAVVRGHDFGSAGAGLVWPGGIRFDVARKLALEPAGVVPARPKWRTYLRFDTRF